MAKTARIQKRTRILIIAFFIAGVVLIGGIIMTTLGYYNGGYPLRELLRRLQYALLFIAMCGAIFLVEFLFRMRFPLALELSLIGFAAACLIGGNLYGLYGYVPFWDKILHTLSGPLFSIVGLCFAGLALKEMPEGKGRAVSLVLFSLLFSLAVGYLWEVFEFAVDRLMPGGYNNQRWQNGVVGELPNGNYEVTDPVGTGLKDTMADLICNLVGTVLFLVPVFVLFWKQPSRAHIFDLERRPKRPREGRKTEKTVPEAAAQTAETVSESPKEGQ